MRLTAALRQLVRLETGVVHPDAVVEGASDVAAAMLAHVAREHVDLIVLGTPRRSVMPHVMRGSVAETVLRRAGCAVLTVPPVASGGGPASPQRILCASISRPARRERSILPMTSGPARRRSSRSCVIELPPGSSEFSQPDSAGYRVARFEYAHDSMKASLADMRGTCDISELLLVGKPEREIIRVATEQESDLIVLGVSNGNAVDLAILGSVTHDVVPHAPCPVLTVRADAA